MYYDVFAEIMSDHPQVAVTITMDLNAGLQGKSNHDKIVLKNLIREAVTRLETHTSKAAALEVSKKLESLLEDPPSSFDASGLVIFASENVLEPVFLQFRPGNKVKIKDHFAIRTLIRSMQRTEHYYILAIAKDNARLFEAVNLYHINEIKNDIFPLVNDSFLPADNLEKSFTNENYTREYFNFVNRNLESIYKEAPLPIVIAGTTENLPILSGVLKNRNVIASVRGAFNKSEGEYIQELHQLAAQAVNQYTEKQLVHSLEQIENGRESGLVESGLTALYRFSLNAQVQKLYLNEEYHCPANVEDGRVIPLEGDAAAEAQYDDIVSEIIFNVLAFGGEVIFLPSFTLPYYEPMVALLRWI